jgi:hypothetical protein
LGFDVAIFYSDGLCRLYNTTTSECSKEFDICNYGETPLIHALSDYLISVTNISEGVTIKSLYPKIITYWDFNFNIINKFQSPELIGTPNASALVGQKELVTMYDYHLLIFNTHTKKLKKLARNARC